MVSTASPYGATAALTVSSVGPHVRLVQKSGVAKTAPNGRTRYQRASLTEVR